MLCLGEENFALRWKYVEHPNYQPGQNVLAPTLTRKKIDQCLEEWNEKKEIPPLAPSPVVEKLKNLPLSRPRKGTNRPIGTIQTISPDNDQSEHSAAS